MHCKVYAGICAAAINAQRSGDLASLLRVKHVPSISGVVGERVTYFNGPVNTQNLREFTRKMFPSNFVTAVSDSNLHSFLDGWSDNRVQAIFFSQKEQFTARFLAPAYYYRENVMFGYVNTMSVSARSIMEKYGLNKHRETLLMFNEQTDSPVATISMQQLPRSTLDEVIEANKYLMLPRISSQTYFDGLCPEEFKIKNRKLCVVLFTRKSPDHDPHRDNFRKYSQRSPLSSNARVQFAYVYEDLQQEFLQVLTKGRQGQSSGADLMVAIVWRMEKQQMKYEWLESRWNADRDREKLCARALEDRLNFLLTTDSVMPYRASIPTFCNEHGYGLLRRIGLKLLSWCDRMWSYVSGHDGATWITLTLSVLFVAGMGYFMHSLATLEEEQVQGTAQPATRPRPQSRMTDEKTMKVFELEYKTYAELVTEADTGLTFVLLVDKDTKPKLLKNFAKVVYNYTRYSALTLSYLQLEYHLGWYKSLLEESTDNDKIDNINMKNCVGTILALNGYRKYFYMFSAKRARKFIRERNNVSEALGLHDLDETSDHEGDESVRDFFLLDEILDGLDIWMDKIFDGSIRRIRITNWPAMEQ